MSLIKVLLGIAGKTPGGELKVLEQYAKKIGEKGDSVLYSKEEDSWGERVKEYFLYDDGNVRRLSESEANAWLDSIRPPEVDDTNDEPEERSFEELLLSEPEDH